MPESYPTTISTPPTTVANHTVLAWMETPRRAGEYPGGIVLAHSGGEYQPYVTWVAYTKDGGLTWDACWGHYYLEEQRKAAWDDFYSRAHI